MTHWFTVNSGHFFGLWINNPGAEPSLMMYGTASVACAVRLNTLCWRLNRKLGFSDQPGLKLCDSI